MELRYPISEEQIAELERMDEFHGGGSSCVKAIIQYLRLGEQETALVVRRNEGDKTRQYPDIEEHLHRMFGCRSHQKRDCDHWLCDSSRKDRLERLKSGRWCPPSRQTK